MSFARRGCVCVVLTLVLWTVSALAFAHPSAISSFEARTDGQRIAIVFRIDATSMVELITRKRGAAPKIEKEAIRNHHGLVRKYLDERFALMNDGRSCPRLNHRKPLQIGFDKARDKVRFEVVYLCGKALDQVRIKSSLFHDEENPHKVVGTFRHRRALERYFFSLKESEARISVNDLAQVGPSAGAQGKPFRMAKPPPGAFAGVALSASVASSALPSVEANQGGNRAAQGEGSAPSGAEPSGQAQQIGSGFWAFLWQGIIHIFGGLDHVLFVICLVVAVRTWRELAIVVTSFTVAHSITLVLGSLQLVVMSPKLVEPIIALSIIYVAVENMVRKEPKERFVVTFLFGLIHGLGFSSVLRDLGLPSTEVAPMLLGFNLGVEAGQLMIVAPLFPLVRWLQERDDRLFRWARIALCTPVTLIAAWWFIERVS